MMKSMLVVAGLSLVSAAAFAQEKVSVKPGCGYVKTSDDSRRVYSDGRVWDKTPSNRWTVVGTVGRDGYKEIVSRLDENKLPKSTAPEKPTLPPASSAFSNNSISSRVNSNTSIYSGNNSNTSIYSGRTSNTTIAGPGDSNTTIKNDGRKNITIEGSGPATVRYSGSGDRSSLNNNYYNGR